MSLFATTALVLIVYGVGVFVFDRTWMPLEETPFALVWPAALLIMAAIFVSDVLRGRT